MNKSKCEFGKERLTFLGHIIMVYQLIVDPNKTKAIVSICPPRTPTELRRFLGMVNQLGKFTPRIAELSLLLQLLGWEQCFSINNSLGGNLLLMLTLLE